MTDDNPAVQMHEQHEAERKGRRIIQVAIAGVANVIGTQCDVITIALCDDGTLWEITNSPTIRWRSYPAIPQPHDQQEPHA